MIFRRMETATPIENKSQHYFTGRTMGSDFMHGDDTILFSFEAVRNGFGAYGPFSADNFF